ncbi:sulfatase, partial [Singulisphaera rosea]
LGADFPWLIPLGVTALVSVPASLIILYAWRRGSVRLGVPVGLLSFLGFLDLCSRLRLELWATAIISIGLATQSVRFVRSRRERFLRSVRMSVGWLVAALVATMLVTVGGRWWQEYRQGTTLSPSAPGAQNVLLIVWDTVRASNTSLHGYPRVTTPNLDRLARGGVKFDLAFSSSSWTLPSHASLFTGRWPHEVGVNWKSPVREGVPTLAGYLAEHGYDTAGFVANLDYCSRETGLARGFAHYEDFSLSIVDTFTRYIALGRRIDASAWQGSVDAWVEARTGRWHDLIPQSREHAKDADAINGAFLGWLENRKATHRPFFAFLNYNDAHSPYEVPDRSTPGFGLRPSTSAQRQTLQSFTGLDKTSLSNDDVHMAIDVYDDCISYLDKRLGSLLEELGRKGVLENTLVIVTSDHGEHLGDHRLFFHGCSLYRQLVHVPLVIAGRKWLPEGRTVAESVGLCDLPSTVIDVLGLASKPAFPGRSF